MSSGSFLREALLDDEGIFAGAGAFFESGAHDGEVTIEGVHGRQVFGVQFYLLGRLFASLRNELGGPAPVLRNELLRGGFSFFLYGLESFQRAVEAAFIGGLVADKDAEIGGGGHFVEVRDGNFPGDGLEANGAVFEPVGFRDFVDERGFGVVGRLVIVEEAVEEGFVGGGIFARDDELAAGQAVFESILAGSSFTFGSAGSGGTGWFGLRVGLRHESRCLSTQD
jgi:hypothetical protein